MKKKKWIVPLILLPLLHTSLAGCSQQDQRDSELSKDVSPPVFSLYKMSDQPSRFGLNRRFLEKNPQDRGPGQNDLGYFNYDASVYPNSENDSTPSQPYLIIDHDALALGARRILSDVRNVKHGTIVVQGKKVYIGVTPKDDQELDDSLRTMLYAMASNITPRAYEIQVSTEDQLKERLDLRNLKKSGLASGLDSDSGYAIYDSKKEHTQWPLMIVDRIALATGLGHKIGKTFPALPSNTILTTDDVIFIGIPISGDESCKEILERIQRIVEETTPSYYKVKIMEENRLRSAIDHAQLKNTGPNSITAQNGDLDKIIRNLGDDKPPPGLGTTDED